MIAGHPSHTEKSNQLPVAGRRFAACAIAALALCASCAIAVDYSGTSYRCDEYGECPSGFECRDGTCVPIGTPAIDGGADGPTYSADAREFDADGGVASIPDAAPLDAGLPAACGTAAKLVDDFDDGVPDPQWVDGNEWPGAARWEEDGQLVIRVDAQAGAAWAGYVTRHLYDLTGSHVQVRVDQVGPEYTLIELVHHAGGAVQIYESWGTLRAEVWGLPSGDGLRAEIPYDPTAHRWWRIREQAGVLYYEVSPDGTGAWTSFYQEPNPLPVDMVSVGLWAGGSMATDTEARMDDLNSDGDRDQPWCPIADLADDFEDGAIADLWGDSRSGPGCELVETGGEAAIWFDGAPDAWCVYESAPVHDACNGHIALEVTGPLDVADAEMWLGLSFPLDDGWIFMDQWEGALHVFKGVGGTAEVETSSPYDPGEQRWWRIREASGTLHVETSPEGSSWTTLVSVPTGFDCSTAYVDFGAGLWNTWANGPIEARFDNVNRIP